jgi:hypothetical protein
LLKLNRHRWRYLHRADDRFERFPREF